MRPFIQAALQQELENGAALLLTGAATRRYVTGFPSSAGAVLITRQGGQFFVDFRYAEKARAMVSTLTVCLSENLYKEVGEQLRRQSISRLYVETTALTAAALKGWRQALAGIDIPDDNRFDHLLARLRSVKHREELACIRQAQALTDETFSYILDRLAVGRTEREIALDIEFYMRRQGSEGAAFDFIVVSGKHSSLPHGVPTDKPLTRGDFVTMDFGAVVGGYCSDMTRTVAIGFADDHMRQVYDTVRRAQETALAAIRPGAVCREVDAAARDRIRQAGYGDCFGHGLGHSLGLEIHESPACNTRCDTVLQPNMVMTVEPGIYLEDRFGVRIEDLVVVTPDGHDNLTRSPKQLLIV